MKTFLAFCLGAAGVVYLRDPESVLGIERISVGIERASNQHHAQPQSKIEKKKHRRKSSPEVIERWREAQDAATEKLLNQ